MKWSPLSIYAQSAKQPDVPTMQAPTTAHLYKVSVETDEYT